MTDALVGQASSLPENALAETRQAGGLPHDRALPMLAILAALSTCLYGVIAYLSWRFDYDSDTTQRPIVVVLILLAAAFLAYLFAIRLAWQAPQDHRLLGLIVWPAVIFRVVLLFSLPIQETDIYRYLWDGAVSTAGVGPFKYSPEQVRSVDSTSATDPELRKLVALRDREPATAEILRRVHFGELPTIYPPTSQVVFAAATVTTPANSPVLIHVFVMKAWFIAFDLATLFVVIGLLKLCRRPVGLCVIYAWCPLLLKEVANSGHLDAVAVFLTTWAVYLAARLLASGATMPRDWIRITAHLALVGLLLALAIGAKLYPIVLAPLIVVVLAKKIGWRYMFIPAAVCVLTTLFVLWPMLPRTTRDESESESKSQHIASGDSSALETLPPPPEATRPSDPSLGVATFLRRWEMNDFIFLLLVENLRPTAELPPDRVAWFSILPESFRRTVVESVAGRLDLESREVPFLLTRALTGVAFIVVAMWLAWRASRTADVNAFLDAGFLTLAWFWLLCPTQNPWYWTWALPLLAFARSRAWLAISGLVLLYYLRFWLSYHWPDTPVLGTGYVGYAFFDFVVTWFEFAPWLLCLVLGYAIRRKSQLDSAHPQ